MRDSVFYTIFLGFVSGVFLRSFFDIEMHFLILSIGLACFGARKLLGNSRQSILFLVTLISCSAAFGAWRMDTDVRIQSVFSQYENTEVTFEARVASEPEIRTLGVHLYVEPKGFDTSERILVTVDRFSPHVYDLAYGDHVSITGTIEKPEPFTTDEGRIFDYAGYLRARDVHYMVRYGDVEYVQSGDALLMSGLFAQKHKFESTIEAILPQPEAGLGEGILLGVRRALGPNLEEAFRITGIIHIVVLSGYNIMIIIAWLTYILSFLFAPRMRTIFGISSIVLFVLLVGVSASAVRAGVMASLLLIARSTGRTYAIVRALMIAGVVMLIANPFLLVHDTGFQLSFLATLGLIVLAPLVERQCMRIPEGFFGLRTILTATIATQIMVLPLLLYHTGLLSLVSIAANMLVLPAVSLAMLLTFLTGILGQFSVFLGTAVGFVAYISLTYIISVAEIFARLPFSSISIGAFPFWIVPLAYILLGVWITRASEQSTQASYRLESLSDWTIEEEQKEPAAVLSTTAGSSLKR